MIEDTSLGLKVAQSDEEAFWTKVKATAEQTIKSISNEKVLNEALIEVATKKLEQCKS